MDAEPIVYENAIVTFLDILGFKEIVLKSSAQEAATYLDAIEYFNKEDLPESDIKPYVHIFSDSIIRIRPVETVANKKYPMGLLWHELLDIVHIQTELTPHNVILRGAISYGETVSSEKRVFGPALVRAVELEKNCAIYPRVIVDPELLREFENNKLLRSHNLFEDELKYVYGLLQEDNDGFWFVDYLRAAEKEIDDPESYLNFLNSHRNLITKRAVNLKLPGNPIQKIMWLTRYQNKRIASMSDNLFKYYETDRSSYAVGEAEINSLINTGKVFGEDED